MERNLATYGPFAALERVLAWLVKGGADRQEMHERLRGHALRAWEALRQGEANPLVALVARDEVLGRYLSEEELVGLMDASRHLGDAPGRARGMAEKVRRTLVMG
jgi:adenylosuccinate lyase